MIIFTRKDSEALKAEAIKAYGLIMRAAQRMEEAATEMKNMANVAREKDFVLMEFFKARAEESRLRKAALEQELDLAKKTEPSKYDLVF